MSNRGLVQEDRVMSPPIKRASRRASDSPSPVPCCARTYPLSTLVKSSNARRRGCPQQERERERRGPSPAGHHLRDPWRAERV